MATVKTFPALRFTDKAGDIAANVCPPYDIVSPEERASYIKESENNIIRLELPIGENAYADAGALYKKLRREWVLACDETPGFYVYEEEFSVSGKTYRIKGVFARVKLCEFSENVVLPHEETLSKAKNDRFNLMSATYCNFSPIYSMYTDAEKNISGKLASMTSGKPDIEFTAPDGVIQRLWKLEKSEETDAIEKAFASKQLFIADGHHRYETALNFKKKLVEDGVITDGEHPANYVMMFLIDMENPGLVVFPTHRLVCGLAHFDLAAALAKIEEYFEVSEISEAQIDACLNGTDGQKVYVLASEHRFFRLSLKESEKTAEALDALNPGKSDAYKNLDVTVLHSLILEKLFGIDKENMARQINLSYTRDADEAVRLSTAEGYNCAFLIRPTAVSEIKDVALAGEKMPQKSTYFYPKLITGLVMNELVPVDNI